MSTSTRARFLAWMRALGALWVGALSVVALSACGDDPKAASGDERAGTVAHVKVFSFRPNPLKVAAGTKVTWVNDDDIAHTVTSGRRAYEPGDTGKVASVERDGLFDTALEGAGKKASHTFDKPGSFRYFCDRHPGMEGEVVVSPVVDSS